MPGQTQQHDKLTLLLADLFQKESSEAIENLSSQLLQTVQSAGVDSRTEAERSASEARWDGGSSVLITYADSLVRRDEAGLLTLSTVINAHYGALASVVHVLPFLRASSDGGFAVASHEELEPRLGDWAYLELLSRGRTLMADLVLNHVSASHPWVQQFIRGEEPGLSCIYAPDPSGDWSGVIRPRSSSLFTTLATSSGPRPVWSTFGPDQLDVDWSKPEVLQGFTRLLSRLCAHGVSWLRLDAVGFVWKEEGSSCMHHDQAYGLVRILRLLLEQAHAHGVVVTETNVPEEENLSYLRSGEEAHLAYNFPLPPLLLEALISQRADLLNSWLNRWPTLPSGTTLLNFSACHDGVGLRPLEGLMDGPRLHRLLEACERRGGLVSHRRLANGRESPYEINISWWSAMAGEGRDGARWQLQRFLLSQLLLLALPGVPAFYLPALLAQANDLHRFNRTGHRRDLHRPQVQADALERELADVEHPATKILAGLEQAMAVRRAHAALNPSAAMRVLSEQRSDLVVLERGDGAQRLWVIHNFSGRRLSLHLASRLQHDAPEWWDALHQQVIRGPYLELEPCAVHWLELPQ